MAGGSLRHRYCRLCHPDTAYPTPSLCRAVSDTPATVHPVGPTVVPDCIVCLDLMARTGCGNGHGPWPYLIDEEDLP